MIRIILLSLFLSFLSVYGQPATGPALYYQPVPDFFRVPVDGNIVQPTGVAVNSRGHVFVFNKGFRQLEEFDAHGSFVRSLGQGLFKDPHGLRIDKEDNIWTTDLESHVVIKLSPEGRVLMVLGQNNTSGLYDSVRQRVLFFKPADIAFSENGDLYIADGYGNSRMVRLDKSGNLIRAWGKKGGGQGDFDNPHNVVIPPNGRVYVADRNNRRIQVFNANGDFIAAWTHLGKPWGLTLSPDNHIYMTDGDVEKILKLDLEGNIKGIIHCGPGTQLGQMHAAHGIASGPDGGIYVTEVLNWRVQKFMPVATTPGAWAQMETINKPKQRSENAFLEVNDKFYLLGGRGTLRMDIYEPRTKTWSTGANLPVEIHHFQPVNYNGEIYILGALTGPYPGEKPIAEIHIYNPTTNQWRIGGMIPPNRLRGAAGLTVYNDKIYLVAGIQNGHIDGHVSWVDEFDPKTGKWRKLPDAPRARDHFQVAVIEGKMYAAGGRNTSQKTGQPFQLTLGEVDVFDFSTEKWTTLPSPIPTQRAGNSCLSINGKLVVLCGESGTQEAGHREVEVYDPATQTWSKWPQMNQGRHGTGAIYYNNTIYVAAGSGNRGGGPELSRLDYFPVPK
ncbi:MAG: kelch repeat-containing protein [Bacteroidia bacterium]|nr:kelch repeat-containing protein [Bacteroidia bacterium]